eukprot:Amastigsp_a177788_10.p5 type:complete len:105 gc:universal Amastigsp_a177788_10:983-1297(+)
MCERITLTMSNGFHRSSSMRATRRSMSARSCGRRDSLINGSWRMIWVQSSSMSVSGVSESRSRLLFRTSPWTVYSMMTPGGWNRSRNRLSFIASRCSSGRGETS